jgi:hypothetical protein
MIFEEEGTLGPSAEIVRMEPAELNRFDDEHVLLTYDPMSGSGGYTIDAVWIFDDAVPISVSTLVGPTNDSISRALKEILPPGCGIHPDKNPLDLKHFRFLAQVWPSNESSGTSACDGTVKLELGIENHRIVVVDKQYTR